MNRFDIAPFALPNCAPGEVRFEEPRDIVRLEIALRGPVPAGLGLSYLQKTWPGVRLERQPDTERPGIFGWNPVDDQFNSQWRKAAVRIKRAERVAVVSFRGLSAEYPAQSVRGCDVVFRRTLGIRVEGVAAGAIAGMRVFTASEPDWSAVRVELGAGKRGPSGAIRMSGYNAVVGKVRAAGGGSVKGGSFLPRRGKGVFEVHVRHMRPAHRYCGDAGHLTFAAGMDAFTISLEDLRNHGAIWSPEWGFFITPKGSSLTFAEYRKRAAGGRTVNREVRERPEHAYAMARSGQPRAHPVNYNLGVRHARQRFWLESNGDVILHRKNVVGAFEGSDRAREMQGADSKRFLCRGNARFLFGLEGWPCTARFTDPSPVPVYNIAWRKGGLVLEQKSLCVPLLRGILEGEGAGDEATVGLVRFRFRNDGDAPREARLVVRYSADSRRSGGWLDAYMVPKSPPDRLMVRGGRVTSAYQGRQVLRLVFGGTMGVVPGRDRLTLARTLKPGGTCEVVLKIPYIALEAPKELSALAKLDFRRCHGEATEFWRREGARGAQLSCPETHFADLHKSHLMHVWITDIAMPGRPHLVNTSVGSSTYGNYSNESCMIIQELDQRGLHDEVERRLEVWLKYQGTVPQPGNFTDYQGMFFGAGGFECGDYNQHHGWVLWMMAEHYRLTRNRKWLEGVAPALVQGADWVFRQRRNTCGPLPHSRGWERGFLPAGSLEDVTDFHYWLSTNCLTWRGCDSVAEVLEDIGHSEAQRLRRESDAYRKDLVRGLEEARRHAPLVRLRDGRWVPTYPSRLYVRGRDTGWIREVLEGSVYLLISGLYDHDSREARWILDDYQDNRYVRAPYGYRMVDPESNLIARGGFSIQPNLLAGLMPHLFRDEPEIYIWMFLNAWTSCYREEINAMCEHPLPELGYSNAAQFKTSDEANAVMWLRYMHVYWTRDLLHLGRALPRAWMADGREASLKGVATYFGKVSVRYISAAARGVIRLEADLGLERKAPRILARFRHPEGKRIRSARVNGKKWRVLDPVKGDIDISALRGKVMIQAFY